MSDTHTLELFLDFEILKLLYQMKTGATLDINVVNQQKKLSEIHASRKKSKIDRDISVLSIKGDNILQFSSEGFARCVLGDEIDFPEEIQGEYFGGTPKSEKETQTELNFKDITSMQYSLASKKRKVQSRERSIVEQLDLDETVAAAASVEALTSGESGTKTCSNPETHTNDLNLTDRAEQSKFLNMCSTDTELSPTSLQIDTSTTTDTLKKELTPVCLEVQKKHPRGRKRKGKEIIEHKESSLTTKGVSVSEPSYSLTKSGRKVKRPAALENSVTSFEDEMEEHVNIRSYHKVTKNVTRKISDTMDVEKSTEQITDSGLDKTIKDNADVKKELERGNVPVLTEDEEKKEKVKKKPREKKQCPLCGKLVANLSTHSQIHSEPYKCPKCDKTFTKLQNLKRHETTVHQKKFPFNCDECGKGYTWKKFLLEHIEQVHKQGNPEQKTFFPRIHQCEQCSQAFKTMSVLKGHIDAVHKKLRSFHCEVCDKNFAKKYHLNVHLRTHSGEKPYLCSFCGKGYVDKGNMDTHVQTIHLRKLRYKCNDCGMEFRRKKFLTMHRERGHSGNSPAAVRSVAPVKKKPIVRKPIIQLKSKDIQIVFPLPSLIENVQLQYQSPIINLNTQQDVLNLAVDQITKDINAMEDLAKEKSSSQSDIESEPNAIQDSQLTVPVRNDNVVDSAEMQNIVQPLVASQGILHVAQDFNKGQTFQSGQVSQSAQLQPCIATPSINLDPGQTVQTDIARNKGYVTTTENVASGQNLVQVLGLQPCISPQDTSFQSGQTVQPHIAGNEGHVTATENVASTPSVVQDAGLQHHQATGLEPGQTMQPDNIASNEGYVIATGNVESGQSVVHHQATSLGPNETMQPEIPSNEGYVTAAENVASGQSVVQTLGGQSINIFKVEGDDEPYFLIQEQSGSIAVLRSLPTDAVVDDKTSLLPSGE